ncbi:uncharacterized protein LOC136080970 isoform X2 [Hydra vulgaris]|uniref:Uncharacterized protein LOC136080970 isoform X2 n=1 Tax=Hydra vulgaris TaxID=6087 RepID=A0ABM4BYT0_HYDVU
MFLKTSLLHYLFVLSLVITFYVSDCLDSPNLKSKDKCFNEYDVCIKNTLKISEQCRKFYITCLMTSYKYHKKCDDQLGFESHKKCLKKWYPDE